MFSHMLCLLTPAPLLDKACSITYGETPSEVHRLAPCKQFESCFWLAPEQETWALGPRGRATGQVGVWWGALAGSRQAGRLPQRGLLLRQARQLRCALSLARLQLGFTAAHRDAVGAAAHTSVQEASRHLLADL